MHPELCQLDPGQCDLACLSVERKEGTGCTRKTRASSKRPHEEVQKQCPWANRKTSPLLHSVYACSLQVLSW